MSIQTPTWVKDAIFYQIFPDRFARSPRTPHPRGIQFKPWGSPPSEQGFQGGDLYGIVDHLDYLQDLGINALYLNPIFASAANHRYHTFDYMQVDPLLGGDAALRELLDQAHARGIRVVLDGVFNHASRGFWPFHHVLENGSNSPYVDWFYIHGWPLHPYRHDADHPLNYEAWWNLAALPKLNTSNPGVRDYIMNVARHWIEFGIDGWRLDVPAEIDDDAFWQEFRHVVKQANPEAYICGEIWGPATRWLQGDQFDAVMNYLFMGATLSFVGDESLHNWYHSELNLTPQDAEAFGKRIADMLALYDWQISQVQYNLIDSHDTPRALWILGHDKAALKLAVLLQMTMPGAPSIYYGDEIGMAAGTDPDCREAFPWHDTAAWDQELLAFYRQATALRHAHEVLRRGSFEQVYSQGMVYGFRRRHAQKQALIFVNAGNQPQTILLSQRLIHKNDVQQVWPDDGVLSLNLQDGNWLLTIPAQTGAVWLSEAVPTPSGVSS